MGEPRRAQAEGLHFLSDYRPAFTTRSDGSAWPKCDRTWLNADRYFRGLLRPGSPNTITDIAEKMHVDQERLERFVRESPWEHENVEIELRERVPEAIQAEDAALIVDGMGIPKAGEDSVGVVRQWCGATGKVDTCKVTVDCTLARPGEQQNADQLTWPLGMRLFLLKKWTGADDADYDSPQERERFAQRREDAAIPDEVEHRSKLDIAVELIEQAVSIKEPGRNLPLAMVGSVLIVGILYVATIFVAVSAFGSDLLATLGETAMVTVAESFLGPLETFAILFGRLLATISSANALILSTS